jgi:hypothetical protein
MQKRMVLLLALALPLRAEAQTFQPGRLAAGRDSFEVVYQGQPIGGFVMSLAKTGDNFTFTGVVSLPRMGVNQTDSIVFNATTLAPSLITTNSVMGGMGGASRVVIANGKATGTSQQSGPGGTMQNIAIDATVAPGVIGDGSDPILIQTLDLSDGMSMTYLAFDGKTGKTKSYALKVAGKETVTVPAGTIEAWKIELLSDESATIWVSTAEPRKLVMLRLDSAQLEMRRAK